MEVLEILGKSDQSGHRMPIRMSKTTGFPGRTRLLMRKGGVAGGVKNAESLGKNAVQSGQKAVYFERILVRIVRVRARLSSFSSNPCSKAVQNDHIRSIYVNRLSASGTQKSGLPNRAMRWPKPWASDISSRLCATRL